MHKWEKMLQSLKSQTDISPKTGTECDICQDIGYLRKPDGIYEKLEPCVCTIKKQNERILANCGIAEAFKSKRLDDYQENSPEATRALKACRSYLDKFFDIEKDDHNSIGFFGKVGSGKTHLSIALANELMEKGVQVRYMEYRPVMDEIKRNMMDEAYHHRKIAPYKNCRVLLIDDFLKGAFRNGQLNESDMGIIYGLFNHRYLNKLPIIISSEYYPSQLINFDDAIGSRISERCRMHTVQFGKEAVNYRLQGVRVVK